MSQGERHIYIVGKPGLQTELLVLYIRERTNVQCFVENLLPKIPSNSDNSDKSRLILVDCSFKSREEIAAILESESRTHLLGDFTVLLNLNRTIDIERYALDKGVRGFIYEQDSVHTLLKMVEVVFNGGIWVSREKMTECLLVNSSRSCK